MKLAMTAFLVLAIQGPLTAQAPTSRGLENLAVFARLFGYVRHFHPSDGVETADWGKLALTGVRVAENAPDARELAAALQKHFRSIAPTLRVYPSDQEAGLPAALTPPEKFWSLGIAFWEHTGYGPGRRGHIASRRFIHAVKGTKAPETAPDPASPMIIELGGGVTCLVPQGLWTDREHTLPPTPSPGRRDTRRDPEQDDASVRAVRLAAVVTAWNAVQHFYPHFSPDDHSWNKRLPEFLEAAATAPTVVEFVSRMRSMMLSLGDSQAMILHAVFNHPWAPSILWSWVEDQLVITHVDPALAETIHPGDVVTAIDDVPAPEAVKAEQLISGGSTPGQRRYAALLQLLMDRKDRPLKLTLSRPGKSPWKMELERTRRGPYGMIEQSRAEAIPYETRPEPIEQIEPGVWYADLSRISDVNFDQHLPEFKKARGLIIDLRGKTPNVSDFPWTHFHKATMTSPALLTPRIRNPDRRDWQWDTGSWNIVNKGGVLAARKIFLCDERTSGSSELSAYLVRRYKLGDLVGSPTAGNAGLISAGRFPGGLSLGWSAQRIRLARDHYLRGHGIQPTIPCIPTIKAIRAGQDTLLQKALELLR